MTHDNNTASYFLEFVPDVIVEHLLTERAEGGDRGEDAGVQLAVGADLLHHVDEVAIALLLGAVQPVYAALGLVFAETGHVEV